ncbi:MAG: hypothetical protein HYV09_30270 [Deltaproteobacteria bacterium]|nr:hypothetical protein [Deltaproteobacteria bacterium]
MRHLAMVALAAAALMSTSCEVGQGVGRVYGDLRVEGCGGKDLSAYSMDPHFFGAIAVGRQLLIRIQRGGDLQEYTDNLVIAVDDLDKVVDNQPIEVQLQRPPGSGPEVPAPLVRMTLSLRGTCGSGKVGPNDNPAVVLHVVRGTITFKSILRGDPSSSDTNSKRIEGFFNELVLEDPRHEVGQPARSAGTLSGDFKFFYQRGGPAQPFP